jgi:ribosomal-protein-alanine N-acetyltransferase
MGNGIGMIAQIGVSPEFQHKGHGTQLLARGVEELKKAGAQQIVLETLPENSIAHKLYEKVGFQKNEVEGHLFYVLTA